MTTQAATLPANLSITLPTGETIRHILLGSPGGIRQTIHLLHTLKYVEPNQWSPLIDIPDNQLILTPDQGDVISILMKRL
ncbi:hypothetical protein IQ260_19275 [Leptolyngbya cf. ectocarpi LEGE 11479]|uniref:Uncharacterized protein n=1 Tax=Leptolyngbya cf. ectocarpi LEGE 11479 TaxID=1828722 RepID=A0A928ZWP6_LEPEC|nr:hypothetical protein [Leptolyngbya ectocarpi]MBE9068790.1 hypothetical protein [Leptolyngbya cf. ectocarpi LEGE 11479]